MDNHGNGIAERGICEGFVACFKLILYTICPSQDGTLAELPSTWLVNW